MHHATSLTSAAIAALLLQAVPARAALGPEPAAPVLAVPGITQAVSWVKPEPRGPYTPADSDTTGAITMNDVPGHPQVDDYGVYYRPHPSSHYHHSNESSGVTQLHIGSFEPDGKQASRFDVGMRAGSMVDNNLQLGVALDWITKTEHISNITTTTPGPGGIPIVVQHDLGQSSSHLFPAMGYLQLMARNTRAFAPYVGIGGGYEVMVLSGDDFVSGKSFEGTFTGWGWQAWGGAGLSLGGHTRLNGEVFMNSAQLARNVLDPVTGFEVRETVNGDGGGMRVGLAWGF